MASRSGSGDEAKNETDWADIYTTLLTHTSMSYEDIGKRSIPQLEAIMARLGKHISLKIGIPFGTGGHTPVSKDGYGDTKTLNKPGETPCIDDIMLFCNSFGTGR